MDDHAAGLGADSPHPLERLHRVGELWIDGRAVSHVAAVLAGLAPPGISTKAVCTLAKRQGCRRLTSRDGARVARPAGGAARSPKRSGGAIFSAVGGGGGEGPARPGGSPGMV